MVVQPATGTTFKDGEYGAVDNRLFDRGPLCSVLVRDNLGADTNISPYTAGTPPTKNFWPLAEDGQLRDDLFADVLKNGQWEANPLSNEGWWRVGALDERGGPDRKPSIRHDDQMILSSNFPYDTDLTGEGITIQFTAIEQFKPVMARLLMNLPLTDPAGASIVESVGVDDYALSKPVDADSVDRQILLVFARKRPGGFIYCVEGYPLVKLTDIGNKKRSKTDADASSLTFTALPSAFHTDIDASDPDGGDVIPAFYTRWVGGDAWSEMQYVGSP